MLLSKKTTIRLTDMQANYLAHMNYAASKLWNVLNYERRHYQELGLEKFPDWYYQKKVHKQNIWYKSLPSQTAQEVCKLLGQAWKSFFPLLKTGGVENPHPPRYKNENIPITYMQKGLKHESGSDTVRFTIPKRLRDHMESMYGISAQFLYLKSSVFENADNIKQIHVYPPEDGECRIIVVYEVPDVPFLPDNGKYLSIDVGVHNLMTCLDSTYGSSFIIGRKYLSVCRKYDKEIARVQSQWYARQSAGGIKHPKGSTHVSRLYEKKNNCVLDDLHKNTRYIADYCHERQINTVVIGNIKGIRKDKDLGVQANQQLHAFPYEKIYKMLEYKLALYGIRLVRQEESYTSQCSPLAPKVSKRYAAGENRVMRGLYRDGDHLWNADVVGAYNILRKYLAAKHITTNIPALPKGAPVVVKVAV